MPKIEVLKFPHFALFLQTIMCILPKKKIKIGELGNTVRNPGRKCCCHFVFLPLFSHRQFSQTTANYGGGKTSQLYGILKDDGVRKMQSNIFIYFAALGTIPFFFVIMPFVKSASFFSFQKFLARTIRPLSFL